MSVVFLYSGEIRTWAQCFPNHLQMLGKADAMYYSGGSNNVYNYHIEESRKAPETVPDRALSMWQNRLHLSQFVKDDNSIYCILRPDITFSAEIDLSQIHDGKIYIPTGNDYRDGINDQCAFGRAYAVRVYLSLFQHSMDYYNSRVDVLFHPETYLNFHLKNRGVEVVRLPQTNTIIR